MIILVLLSLAATVLASFLVSFGFCFIRPELGYAVFWITFGAQIIIMEPVNRILRIKSVKAEGDAIDAAIAYEKTVGKQYTTLQCQYCSEPNRLHVKLNEENILKCSKCGNVNKVMTQFVTTRVTDPMTFTPPEIGEMHDELEPKEGE